MPWKHYEIKKENMKIWLHEYVVVDTEAEGGSVAMASEGEHAAQLGWEADWRLLQRRLQ